MRIYRDCKNPYFFLTLQNAPQTLQPTQADEYFRLSMNYLPKLRKEYGLMILEKIRLTLQDENIRFVFIHNHHLENLPYNKKFCQPAIIRIFIAFLDYDLSILELHSDIILNCVPLNPLKWLTFLALYSQKYTQSNDPFIILDILFKQDRYFSTPDILPKYLQLLVHLCKTNSEFRELRIQHCWHQITSFLTTNTNTDSLGLCYDSLIILAPLYENQKCPLLKIMPSICSHLDIDILRIHVLTLLSLKKFTINELTECPLIDQLILLARNAQEVKANLILLLIADIEEFAKLFLSNTKWMTYKLPTINDTLRLFLVVFKHSSLRKEIVKSQYFIIFLTSLFGIKHTEIFQIICVILHRIPFNSNLVQLMINYKFIETFLQKTIAHGGNFALNAALVFVDSVISVTIPKEFVLFCDTVADIAKHNAKLSQNACLVAAKLSDNPECLKRMKLLGMVDFFMRMKDDPRAIKFLKNVEDYEKGLT